MPKFLANWIAELFDAIDHWSKKLAWCLSVLSRPKGTSDRSGLTSIAIAFWITRFAVSRNPQKLERGYPNIPVGKWLLVVLLIILKNTKGRARSMERAIRGEAVFFFNDIGRIPNVLYYKDGPTRNPRPMVPKLISA